MKRKQKKSVEAATASRPARTPARTAVQFSAVIACVAFLVYLPALGNNFILDWDDNGYVVHNVYIRSLNFDFLKWAFTNTTVASYWHPLTWISHAIDYAVWGLNPFGHHLTSILLHAVNTGMVVWVTAKFLEMASGNGSGSSLFEEKKVAWIAAGITGLLFGLHPLKVESVAWIAQRKDLLYSFFYMLSINYYLDYLKGTELSEGKNSFRTYMLILLFFFLALCSKPMAVTLPGVLLLLDWYPAGRIRSFQEFLHLLFEKLPFLLLAGIVSAGSVIAQKTGGGLASLEQTTFLDRTLVAFKGVMLYLWNMILPIDLSPLYPYPKQVSLLQPEYAAGIVVVAAITGLCIFFRRKQPAFLAAWLFFLVTLFPVLGFFQAGSQAMADRYLYLPSLGLFVLAGSGAALLWKRHAPREGKGLGATREAVLATAAVLILLLCILSIRQIGVWRDNATFWGTLLDSYSSTIADHPDDYSAYYNRGCIYYRDRKFDLAIRDLDRSIELNPGFADAYVHRGNAYMKKGNIGRALEEYNAAIAKNPVQSFAYVNRAIAYEEKGEAPRAIEDYTRALSLNTTYSARESIYLGRGDLYMKSGRLDLALGDYQKACELGMEAGCRKLAFPFATPQGTGTP